MNILERLWDIVDYFYIPIILTFVSILIIILDINGKLRIRGNKALIVMMWIPICLAIMPKWIGGYFLLLFLLVVNVINPLKNDYNKTNQSLTLCNFQTAGSIAFWLSSLAFLSLFIIFFEEITSAIVGMGFMIILSLLCPMIFLTLGACVIIFSVVSLAIIILICLLLIFVPYLISTLSGISASIKYKQSGKMIGITAKYIVFALFPFTAIYGSIKMKKELNNSDKAFENKEKFAIILSALPYFIVLIASLIFGGMYK